MPETKSTSLRLRMKPSELAEIKAAAEHADVTVSAWVTERLLLCANQELVTVPPPATAHELAAGLPGVQARGRLPLTRPTSPALLTHEERRASIAVVKTPSISPADGALVQDALGVDCLVCGQVGHIVPADHVAFNEGITGPSNLQVLCDDCADGAGDLRDSDQLDAISAAVDARPPDK